MKPLPLRVIRRFKHIGLLLLVAVTAYVTLGRLLMPLVATRKDTIEIQLTNAIGVPVSIGSIKGSWFRFGPSIAITDLRIGDPAGSMPMHHIDGIELVLDVPASLLARQPVVSRISAARLTLTLQEQDDGKWGLAGVPVQGGGNADPLIDFLLSTNVLTLNESEVVLLRRNGQRVALTSLILNVENLFNSHEARMQVRVGEQQEPSQLALQLHGDPRRSFSASLWLDTGRLDLLPLLKDQLPAAWQWQQLQGQGRVWLDVDSNGVQGFAAELRDVDVAAQHDDKTHHLALQHGGVTVTARPVYGKDNEPTEWQVRVQDLGFDW